MTEDEMVGWHHQLNGHESEQTLGDGEGQGSLVCCRLWGCKELDLTEQLNNRCEQRKYLTTVLLPFYCARLLPGDPVKMQMLNQ